MAAGTTLPRAHGASRALVPGFPESAITTSQSGQFVVTGPRVPGLSPPREFRLGAAPRTLTPPTLAIACERIKAETLRIIALPDLWRSAGTIIHVDIEPSLRTNTPIPIAAVPFEAGWKLRMTTPSTLTEERLTRAVVQAVVLDLANRAGNQRIAEPPLWLIEGITQSIASAAVEGTLPTPETRTSFEIRRQGSLDRARTALAFAESPTFQNLSHPNLDQMSERDWRSFSSASEICLHELRRLPDGENRIRNWILQHQRFWNWQTGFIEAFHPIFRSLLDTEKWWAITLANFTGRDAAQAWPADFTLRKLDEALHPVGILPDSGNRARRLAVEDIVEAWEFPRQTSVLRQLLHQLQAIRINAPPDLRVLIHRYVDLVDGYLEARSKVGLTPVVRGQPMANPKILARETIRRLRELDGQRTQAAQESLNPKPSPPEPASPPAA